MGEFITMSDLPSDLLTRKEVKTHIPGVIKNNHGLYEVLPDNSWKNRRCFIIGGGPSLRGFDFSQLKGELVIAVNRGFEKVDAAIMVSQDVRLWGWIETGKLGEDCKRKFNDFKGLKVWIRTAWMHGNDFPFPEDIYTISSTESREMIFNSKNGLPACTNSGLNALCLAICLGANPIYLLGFDMKGEKGRAAWFHDGYPEVQDEEMYKRMMVPNFELFASDIKKAGFKIINLNPDSELKCFEFGRFEDIKKIKRPLITGCYTKNTKYEDEIKRLEKSLIKFGLEYYFEGIENTGDWRKNCHQKVRFVQRCLEKFDRDIIQMDSDCVILKFPELFEQLQEYDIGAHVTPSENFHLKRWHTATDLHNVSVLYLKNNAKVKKLVEAWVKRDATLEDHIDDISFSKALKEFKEFEEIKEIRFPDRYVHIYDRPLKEEPVIELYQASRRLRDGINKENK